MRLSLSPNIEILLLAGYVVFSALLNVVAYLISMFYRKKFDQPSPQAGFLAAIVFAIAFIITLFAGPAKSDLFQIASVFFLLGSAAASGLSVLSLYFTMRKVRK